MLLRHAELLRQRFDADRLWPTLLGLAQRGLHQRITEIAVVIGILRLADQFR
jgi:hypothetical protein